MWVLNIFSIIPCASGKQGFIEYFDEMSRDYPSKSIEFVRTIGEGDLVVLHTIQIWPGDRQYVTMVFFDLTRMA